MTSIFRSFRWKTTICLLLCLLAPGEWTREPLAADSKAADSQAVATVGDRSITVSEVSRLAGTLAKAGQSPDSARAQALEALVRRNLLVLEAEARGMEQDEKRQRMWKKLDGDLLRGALERDLTKDVVVTDEELADMLERATRQVVTREIAFEDSATAARVSAEIRAGKLDFAAAAKQYSRDPVGAAREGLSPQPINELALAFGPLKPLLASQPGDIYGPFQFRQLYYLTKLESRQPVNQEGWDPDALRPRLLEAHKQEVLDNFLAEMKAKYHYRFNGPAAHHVAIAVTRVVADFDAKATKIIEAGGVPPGGDALITFEPAKSGYDEWGLPDSLRSQFLYQHDQGGRTVGVFVDRMAKVPIDLVAPNTNPSKIEYHCDDSFKDDVYPAEAKARGLDAKINYERTRRNRYEQFLVDQLYNEEISEKIKPDMNTLKAYWQENPSAFPPRPVIVATTVCYATEAEAQHAKLRIDAGLAFDALAKEVEASPPPKEGSAAPVVSREQRATKQETWLGVKLGGSQVGDILVSQEPEGRFCVVRLDRLEPGEPDFTSSYDAVLQHYRMHNDEQPFRQFCDQLKTRYPVVIHRDVLNTVQVPG